MRTALPTRLLCATLAWALCESLAASAAAQAVPTYQDAEQAWRVQRDADLRKDDGWLSLVGLTWLQPGQSRIGSAQGLDVVLPSPSVPAVLGTLDYDGVAVTFTPSPGVAATINGKPAARQILAPQPGAYDVVGTGTVTFFVIKRGSRVGIRMRDTDSQARRTFEGTTWFALDPALRVTARLVPHATPTTVPIPTVLGDVEPWRSPGTVHFRIGDRDVSLVALQEAPESRVLFFIFRDATATTDTYPAGRFLYAEPRADGQVVLDFNRAINPPCAYTPYATCPLPPKENMLTVPIRAGERYRRH